MAEERVAREGYALGLAVEENTARRVARGLDDGKLMAAKADGVLTVEVMAHSWHLVVQFDTRNGLSLTAEHIHKRLVGLVNLGL